ncbi:Vps62-related protein [Paenibacillus gorillae]|uniref:Vps62-related protein n=1 Tax=Paenibacillus gorillae TaxID=1243662 RepID=UPI0004B95FF3|nr:Vps62-related protein [Paenibacillus gorillae]
MKLKSDMTKRWASVMAAVLFVTLLAAVGSTAKVSAAGPVTIYRDGNFSGVSQELTAGFYNVNELKAVVGNDQISSVRVAPGYRVTLYKDYNFSGGSKVITADTEWLDDFNDEVSSLKVEVIGGPHKPVTVYANAPYGGLEQEFDVGSYNVEALNVVGNDQISAMRVAPGYKVTLYKNSNFSGDSKVYTSDAIYLDGFNDATSSLKVEAISPLDATAVAVPGNAYSESSKRELLQTFAPRIWFAQGEVYFPSSVEYTFPYVDRYLNPSSGKYELKTKTELNPYDKKLPYFQGDLANAPIYSFWVEKEYGNVDLVYFQFSAYDLGKTVVGQEFGNHVGDFERVTVRLAKFEHEGTKYLKPVQVYYGAHSFGTTYNWNEVDKISGTHPVAYSAFGSHGMWKDQGSHVYQNIVVAQLTDVTNQGTAWDTWNRVQAFEYFPLQSTGVGLGNPWPTWLDKDYTNPNSGAIYRFGNPSQGSLFGQPLLAGGPSGPQEKTSLTSDVILD